LFLGANIPGKKAENMVKAPMVYSNFHVLTYLQIYVGGINMYEKEIRSKMDGWQGFSVSPATVQTTA
jgi:hypothetical protein